MLFKSFSFPLSYAIVQLCNVKSRSWKWNIFIQHFLEISQNNAHHDRTFYHHKTCLQPQKWEEIDAEFNKISLLMAEILMLKFLWFLQNRSRSSVIDLVKVNGHWGIIIEIFQGRALRMWIYKRHLKKIIGKNSQYFFPCRWSNHSWDHNWFITRLNKMTARRKYLYF